MKRPIVCLLFICVCSAGFASQDVFSVHGSKTFINEQEFKVIGLRCSNALMTDTTTDDLIAQLDLYKSYGMNTVSVFFMGSRFGDVKGYRPDASLDPVYAGRMARIIEAADKRGMIVIVGCLYWSTSRAKEDLNHWTQVEANRAVANTVKWLAKNNYRNVIVDPDNEGMAGREQGWTVEALIAAAHSADRSIMVANNTKQIARNSDLTMHFGPKEDDKPWFDSEATPGKTPGGYWGKYSKETHQNDKTFYNYSRIGRYTTEMKQDHLEKTHNQIETENGYVFASTWLQCGPKNSINGPFTSLGGRSNLGQNEDLNAAWNTDIDAIHPDAGILWWMESIKETYGPWKPTAKPYNYFVEANGVVSIEAEHFTHQTKSTYARYTNPHQWVVKTDKDGFSGSGFLQVLPDEWPEGGSGPSSPRDNSGARLTYPIRIANAGTYSVYVRGMSMGGESNGVHVGVNSILVEKEKGASNMSGFRPRHQWVWENQRKHGYAQPAVLRLEKGDHFLHVWNRDDGFRLDKIVLKLKPGAPDGDGPKENPQKP